MEINKEDVQAVIDGDIRKLYRAFVWFRSPQGHKYWSDQASGITPIDVDTLRAMIGEPQGKTLKELDVNPGDVVQHEDGSMWEVKDGPEGLSLWNKKHDYFGITVDESTELYTIISRATPEPKTWGDMTPEEKGALLLADHEGKVIEVNDCFPRSEWMNAKTPTWLHHFAYRVKHEPVRETVTLHGSSSWQWAFTNSNYTSTTHTITFDLIDGKPDTGSIKMDAL